MSERVDLGVLIWAGSDFGGDVTHVLPTLLATIAQLGVSTQTSLAGPASARLNSAVARQLPSVSVLTNASSLSEALDQCAALATTEYLLTLDLTRPAPLTTIAALWRDRHSADALVPVAATDTGHVVASSGQNVDRCAEWLFRLALGLPFGGLMEPTRLFRVAAIQAITLSTNREDVLPETLVRLFAAGRTVRNVSGPASASSPSRNQSSVRRAWRHLTGLWRIWNLRVSIQAADYDDRAYDSPIPLQRYWQRSRFKYITELSRDQGFTLDVGCGSSRIIGALPPDAIAVDILDRKLRYARKFGRRLVQASGFSLPFRDATFNCVICSQVIEHVPMNSPILDELCRVLKPGGRLVLGTPDYDRWEWVYIEKLYAFFAPGGYAEEHITHYTQRSLIDLFHRRGFVVEATRYILRGELILALRKPA